MENNKSNNENKKTNRKSPIVWFKGLKKPTKIVLCSALAVGVASAIVFPTLAVTVWNNKTVSHEVELTFNDDYDSYLKQNNLVSGNKYKVVIHAKDFQPTEYNGSFAFQLLSSDFTTSYMQSVKDVTVSVNSKQLSYIKNVDEFESEYLETPGYYTIDSREGGSVCELSQQSLSIEKNDVEISFVAKQNANNVYFIFSYNDK